MCDITHPCTPFGPHPNRVSDFIIMGPGFFLSAHSCVNSTAITAAHARRKKICVEREISVAGKKKVYVFCFFLKPSLLLLYTHFYTAFVEVNK